MPVAIASLAPGGVAALGVIGALCAGGILQLAWARLARSEQPWWLAAIVLAGLAGTPLFWYAATEDAVGFIGLALFSAALAGMLDFAFSERTAGGFVAGICLAVGVLVDPAALVCVASVAIAAPFLAWERSRGVAGAHRATLAVLLFPSLAAVLAWTFFEWRFTGSPYHLYAVAPEMFHFPHGVAGGLDLALRGVGRAVLYTPLYLASGVLLVRRRPVAAIAYLLVAVDLVATIWLNMRYGAGQSRILLDLVALVALPRRPGRSTAIFLAVVGAGQIALWCTVGLGYGPLHGWLAALGI